MARRLPSLNALHAFESAARHQSFVRAAEELHVTQGAISRHVKLLEDELGVALFRRHSRGIELTPPGRALLPELTAAFERMARATRRVADKDRELRVACAPTFAGRWLARRLGRFLDRNPGLRVTLGHMCEYEDFFDGGFDIGVSHFENEGRKPAEIESRFLRAEVLAPVCSPGYLKTVGPLNDPSDLKRATLIHPEASHWDWRRWLKAAGLPTEWADGGLLFNTLETSIAAAIGGAGVVVADMTLIPDELASGALVEPFGLRVSDETGYFVFAEHGGFEEPKLALFFSWLVEEAAADERAMARAAIKAA